MKWLKGIIIGALIASQALMQFQISHIQEAPLGGVTFPTVVALFESSLAQKITSSATSATLVSGTDKQGVALSGKYGFIVDEGSSNEEFIVCTVASTALTSCTRGVSVTNGKTAVAALQHEHRRGATVKITDHPQLALLTQAANGQQGYPNLLYYTSTLVPVYGSHSFAPWEYIKDYADALTFAGAPDANLTTKGLVELATAAEISAGTHFGSTTGPLFMNPSYFASSSFGLAATGTYGTPGIANRYVTETDPTFLPVGVVLPYASASAPNGWLLANGQAVSRSTYSRLFTLVGTQYGVGNGSTTFNVPDLGGRFPIGLGTGVASTSYDALGEKDGHTTHKQTVAELATHHHNTASYQSTGASGIYGGAPGVANSPVDTSDTGSSTPMNIQNPYITVQYIIKY